jgi:hypothetical protein
MGSGCEIVRGSGCESGMVLVRGLAGFCNMAAGLTEGILPDWGTAEENELGRERWRAAVGGGAVTLVTAAG